ncbi:MAG: class I SAM-dependent methyltransferase [Acetobacteraceae bacterium]
MNDWSRGYVADEPYTVSFQPALAPTHLDLVCRLMGVVWEPPADMAICDIGCGRGYTALVLAAADPRRTVIGIDYNPAHIAEARSIAAEAGLGNAHFIEADLATMTDAEIGRLPDFDQVVSHGVWTWVADPVREGILRILSRKVKPGGVVHMAYNSMPGFALDLATQRLVKTAASFLRGGSMARAREAIEVLRALAETDPPNLHKTLFVNGLLRKDEDAADPAYLAHELLPDHWRPVFFGDIAADLARARLEFVGSATLFENVPELCMTEAQRRVYDSMPPGPAQELVKDICLSRPFRRDVFMRGVQRADRYDLLDRVVMGLQAEDAEPPKMGVQVGTAELAPEMAEPIMAALAEGPQTIGRLRSLPPGRKPNPAELSVLLCSRPTCLPMVEPAPGATAAAMRFHQAVARRFRGIAGSRLGLVAPGTGGGFICGGVELVIAADVGAFPDSTPAERAARLSVDKSPDALAKAEQTVAKVLTDRMAVWRRFAVVQP